MSKKIASLYAEIGADVSGLEKGMNKAAKSMDDFAKQAKTEAKSWESVQKQKMRAYDEYARELTRQYKAQEKAEKDAVRASKQAAKEQAENIKQAAFVIAAAGAIIIKTAKDSYEAYEKLAGGILDVSIASGTTAEESSKLIQVLDDYKISADDLVTASKAMKEKGLSPTIETLASLADKFVAIKDPTERLKFAYDNLGKSADKYLNVLAKGGDVIRQSADGVNKQLILTDKQIKQAEMARLAVDKLSDSWEGAKVSLGAYVGELIVSNDTHARTIEILKERGVAVGRGIEYTDAWKAANAEARNELLNGMSSREQSVKLYRDEEMAAYSDAQSIDAVTQSNKNLSDQLSGQIGLIDNIQSAENSYTEKSKDLAGQRAEAESKLAELRKQGYWEQSDQIQDAIGKLDEIKGKEKELADERAKQSLQFISNILQEQLARDGWTLSEFDAFAAQQEAWGLWSSDVVAKSKAAWQEAQKITDAINNIPSEKNISVKFNVSGYSGVANYDERVANATKTKHASGGMFQIPMSYGNEGFQLGNGDTASGGEGLQIVPKDQMNGGGNAGGANIELIAAIRALTRQMSMQGMGV